MTGRRNRCWLFLCFSKLLRPLWIPNLIVIEIYDGYFLAVFYFAFAELVQTWPPARVLFQIIGDTFGKKNVSGVAAIHHPLGDVDSRSSDICLLVQVSDFVDRTTVNPHSDSKFGMFLELFANFQCAHNRRFRTVAKNERATVARRQSKQFAFRFGQAELLGSAHD